MHYGGCQTVRMVLSFRGLLTFFLHPNRHFLYPELPEGIPVVCMNVPGDVALCG